LGIWVLKKKLNYSIKANGYKEKDMLGMNFSPNNVQLANNQHFGQSFAVKNIFRPYPLITDRNLHSLAKSTSHLVQEGRVKKDYSSRLQSEKINLHLGSLISN
jgi:hypothetical protein